MSSRSDMRSLMEKNKPLLQEASEAVTMTAITEQNWLAVVGVLTSLAESQDEVIGIMSRLMTAEQMNSFLRRQLALTEQGQAECREIQTAISEQTTKAMTELLAQAGRLSEQYLSMQKEQDAWRQRVSKRIVKAVIASQSVLLILSAALQIWLR